MGFFPRIYDQFVKGANNAQRELVSERTRRKIKNSMKLKRYPVSEDPVSIMDKIAYRIGYWNEKYNL